MKFVSRHFDFAPTSDQARRMRIARGNPIGPIGISLAILGLFSARMPVAAQTATTLSGNEPTTVCVTHILFSYWGAQGATVVQSSQTVLVVARQALAKVLEPGADFEKIGREFQKSYPDVRCEPVGPFGRGKMPKPFEDTAFSLWPGQIAGHIITTNYGFHIIRRNPTAHCRHILIAYRGASRSLATRSKEEARRKAEEIRAEALKPGADFAALARRRSEARDAAGGGDVGVFDKGRMIKTFEEAAFALKPGEVSPIIETRFGFHIIQRIE